MDWYVIVLIVISSLIILTIILCLGLHRYVCKRSYRTNESIDKFAENFYGKEYAEEIKRGMRELDVLPKEEIKINSIDNTELTGYFYKGETNKVIIYAHGYHSTFRFDFSLGYEEYYKRGYSLLFIDQRAHQKSKGKFLTFGLKERYDLLSWIKYIDKRFSGNAKIILCGISMGASTVMYTLGLDLPKSVVGAICDCGYEKPIDVIRHAVKEKIKFGINLVTELINIGSIIATGESFKSISTEETLKNNKLPVFIIHGTKDTRVPVEMGYKNFENTRGMGIFACIENAEHGIGYLVNREQYQEYLKEFIKRTGIEE